MNNLALVGTLSGFSGIIVFLGKVTIAGVYIFIIIIIDVHVLHMVGLL